MSVLGLLIIGLLLVMCTKTENCGRSEKVAETVIDQTEKKAEQVYYQNVQKGEESDQACVDSLSQSYGPPKKNFDVLTSSHPGRTSTRKPLIA